VSLDQIVSLRTEELRRRIDGMDREIKAWVKRCDDEVALQGNNSQVNAIGAMMAAFVAAQRTSLGGLTAAGFATDADALAEDLALSQGVWDFFRGKLELRFNPHFQQRIAIADTIAWNCYMPVLKKAGDAGILDAEAFREPPLIYLTAQLFAQTWERGRQPHHKNTYLLGESSLPIPVIGLPWDNVENLWELLAIPHEVAHDLEVDLAIADELDEVFAAGLAEADLNQGDAEIWAGWRREVFADLVALQLVGAPYAEYLLHLLLGPATRAMSRVDDQDSAHPSAFVRVLLACSYLPTLVAPSLPTATSADVESARVATEALVADAAAIEARWRVLYPETPAAEPLCRGFPAVARALMDTPLETLGGATVRSLVPYLPANDARLRDAAAKLAAGQVPSARVQPRWCVSAAQRATTLLAASGKTGEALAGALAELDDCTARYVLANTTPGTRALPSTSRRAYLVSFVDKLRNAHAARRRVPIAPPPGG